MLVSYLGKQFFCDGRLKFEENFPAFHRTRRFITALKIVRHLSLSWASPIQSMYPHHTSWRSILILSTHLHLGLLSGHFPYCYPIKTLYASSPHPYAPHAQPIIILHTECILPKKWRWMQFCHTLPVERLFYTCGNNQLSHRNSSCLATAFGWWKYHDKIVLCSHGSLP